MNVSCEWMFDRNLHPELYGETVTQCINRFNLVKMVHHEKWDGVYFHCYVITFHNREEMTKFLMMFP